MKREPSGRPRQRSPTLLSVISSEGYIMPPHIFEVDLKVNTKVYLDVLKSVVIPWCNQVAPVHKSKETQAWLCTLRPRPEPAGLLRLVIRREHHQHDLPQHQSQPDHRHPPSIRRAPAGACGKACSQFRIRIEVVIEAEGSYIE